MLNKPRKHNLGEKSGVKTLISITIHTYTHTHTYVYINKFIKEESKKFSFFNYKETK